jgi:hypothetical protein
LYLTGGSYDIALKTALGATVWTRRADPVWDIVNDLSSSSGASLIGYLPSGTGAVATTVKAELDNQVLSVFRFMTTAQIADVQANTTLIDVSTPCAVAEVCAGIIKSDLYYPPGTYLRDTLRLNSATNGICIYGAGLGTVIKPKATATYGIQIEGTSGISNMSGFKVRDMKVDMSLMANTSGVSGIYQRNAYGGVVDNVTVTGWGSTNKSLILKDGAYTTQYSNCTFGAGCKIDIIGVSAPNQVTTITFVNCDGGYITSDWATAITILGGAWQTSSAGTFLTLGTVRNFRVYATDIEGFANYFSATASTHSLISRDNDFSGMVGSYPFNAGSQYPTFYTFHDGAGNNPIGNVGSGQQIMGVTLGGGSATLSNSTLEYNLSEDGWVTFSGLLQIGTATTPSGALAFTNLPRAARSGNSGFSAVAVTANGMTAGATGQIVGFVNPGATTFTIQMFSAGSGKYYFHGFRKI